MKFSSFTTLAKFQSLPM